MKAKIEVDTDVDLEIIQHKKSKEKYTPFHMIGKGGYSTLARSVVVDAVGEMLKFNKQEQWLMALIFKYGDAKNLQCVIRGKDLTKTEKNKLAIAYRSLRAKDILRRIKREYYMVNPTFWVPKSNREELYEYYMTLK